MEDTLSSDPRLRTLHLVLRLALLLLLLREAHLRQAAFLGQELPFLLPFCLQLIYGLASAGLALLFKGPEIPFLLSGLDCFFSLSMLVIYPGEWPFSLPLLLATFTAGTSSWKPALLMAGLGTFLFFLPSVLFSRFPAESLLNPHWFFFLVLNLALAGSGLVADHALRQKEKSDNLIALIEAGQELGAILTYERIYKIIITMARNLFHAECSAIYLLDSEGVLRLGDADGPYAKLFQPFDPRVAKSVLSKVFMEKSPRVFGEMHSLIQEQEEILPRGKIGSGMAVPMLIEDRALGLLCLTRGQQASVSPVTLKLLGILANQAAVAIHNVQIHQATSTIAFTDAVSGLYTHAFMQQMLDAEFRRALRSKLPFSILLLDVDYFKNINDTYGHPAGDTLLRQLGSVLKSAARGSDVICRYGGDEILILLPETDRMGAMVVADRFRLTVEKNPFVLASKVVHVTVSMGVTSISPEVKETRQLIENADQALYEAKKQGRNRALFKGASLY